MAWSWEALDGADQDALTRLCVAHGAADPPLAAALLPDPSAVERLWRVHLVREVPGGAGAVRRARPGRAFRAAQPRPGPRTRPGSSTGRRRARPRCVHPRLRGGARGSGPLRGRPAEAASRADGGRAAVAVALGERDLDLARAGRSIVRLREALEGLEPADPLRFSVSEILAGALGAVGRWAEAEAVATRATELEGPASWRARAHASLAIAIARSDRRAEGAGVAERAVALAADDPVARAKALVALLICRVLDPADPRPIAEAAYDAVVRAGIVRFEAMAAQNLGMVRFRHLDTTAIPLIERAMARLGPRRRALGIGSMNLALYALADDFERALQMAERGREAFREAGAVDGERATLGISLQVRAVLGFPEADLRAELDEFASFYDGELESGDLGTVSYWLPAAVVHAALGDRPRAAETFRRMGGDLARWLNAPPERVEALVAGWLDGVPMSPPSQALPGSRMWVMEQLLLGHQARTARTA
ncbi:MAG: hypothetical protein R3F59_26155 [Myxococcota bacterium]